MNSNNFTVGQPIVSKLKGCTLFQGDSGGPLITVNEHQDYDLIGKFKT